MRLAAAVVAALLALMVLSCSDNDEPETSTSSLAAIRTTFIPGSEVLGEVEAPTDSNDQRFLDLVNASRTTPVAWSSDLAAYAEAHLSNMVAAGALMHSDLGSSALLGRWSILGENIGYGPDADAIHNAYMNSEGHRANVQLPDFTSVGSASVVAGNVLWTVQVYGG